MEENVIVQKKNNYTLIIIIGIIVIALGGLGCYLITSKTQEETRTSRKEKKEDKEEPIEGIDDDDDPGYIDEEDDTPVTINDEWGRKYYDFLTSHYKNIDGRVEGYLLDINYDKVPELFLFEYDKRDYSKLYMAYIFGGSVLKTKGYSEAYLTLLYDVKNKKYDNWYIVTTDDDGNYVYVDIGKNFEPTSSIDNSFILSNEEEEERFNKNYIEVPFSLHEYNLGGKDFDEDAFKEIIRQYNKTEIPNDDVMDYINEMIKDMNS